MDLGLPEETAKLMCNKAYMDWQWNGSDNKVASFDRDWDSTKCKIVNWDTAYKAGDKDAYKRCVCEQYDFSDHPQCQ